MNDIDTPNLCIPHEVFGYVTNAIIKAYAALNGGPEIGSVPERQPYSSIYQAPLPPSPCATCSILTNSHTSW